MLWFLSVHPVLVAWVTNQELKPQPWQAARKWSLRRVLEPPVAVTAGSGKGWGP